jgi:acetoin utilization protein AcuB
MIVGMWMTRNPLSVEPHTSLPTAAQLMGKHRIRRLPVIQGAGASAVLVGILSSTDVYRACPPDRNPFAFGGLEGLSSSRTVAQLMTPEPLTTTPEAPLEDVARLMRDRKIGALPVLDEHRTVVGIITESDVFRAFVGILGDHSNGVRVTFRFREAEDVFGFLAKAARGLEVRVDSLISYREEHELLSVVRLNGPDAEALLDKLWKAGHHPLSVLRWT